MQGLTEAAFLLGECFLLGDGVDADVNAAAEWFEKAALKGETRAQTALGLLCLYELKDRAKARQFLEMAAKRGDADAINELNGMEALSSAKADASVEEKKRFWWDRTHELNERKRVMELQNQK
jgi:TPR repeat protein